MTATNPKARAIRNLRWWIGGLLFASTVINYLDRQTLSNLAPYLKQEYDWTNTDYANLIIAFRLAYSVGQTLCGKLLDRIGTRRGLTLSVLCYSVVSMLTALATGWKSFAGFRFLLGLGESANWPAATKAVAEWFPKRERGLATALFDSGSSVGGALAPFVIIPIYLQWGWRPAFVIPGLLGFLWLIGKQGWYDEYDTTQDRQRGCARHRRRNLPRFNHAPPAAPSFQSAQAWVSC
jgi:ACS family hexuronate transporter-like MFS transporter